MLTLNNSLYFVSKHFKQFSVPKVIVCEYDYIKCTGYYDWNHRTVSEIDDKEIYNDNGLIVLSSDLTYGSDKLPIETLLLHEYRHHLQFMLNGYWTVPDYANGESTVDYHKSNIYEQDARLFEVSLGKLDEFTDEFKTVKIDRSYMLNLPSKKFLESLL